MPKVLRRLRQFLSPKPLEPARLAIGPAGLDVVFRRHGQARRLVLRLNGEGTAAVVTVPRGVSRARALDFAARSAGWLEARLAQRGERVALLPGSAIPLRGVPHEIRHMPSRRGTVTADPQELLIHVPGELPHLARRLTDWLKLAARQELTAAAQRYAAAMGVSFRCISIRDQNSRWGSCSAAGELSFSWRLILTPAHVLDYVAAHEVAHLKYMDHGPQFWRLVLGHCPEAPRAKKWLKAHGQDVHRIAAR
ncbi:MAG: M48 family metallopeptidase [Hyphomicrobiales bacterium]